MRHILTSPGFGEKPDAVGLYPEIEKVFGNEYRFHMLDFYHRDGKDRIVPPLDDQISYLHDEIDAIPAADEITILAKSGGSRPIASIDDRHIERVHKFVLFVPPWRDGDASLKRNLAKWGGSEQDDGSWVARRRNGGDFIVSKEYVGGMGKLSLMDSYQKLARLSQLVIVRAMEDRVTPPIRVELIDGATHVDIAGADHHFTVGDSRKDVITALVEQAVLR